MVVDVREHRVGPLLPVRDIPGIARVQVVAGDQALVRREERPQVGAVNDPREGRVELGDLRVQTGPAVLHVRRARPRDRRHDGHLARRQDGLHHRDVVVVEARRAHAAVRVVRAEREADVVAWEERQPGVDVPGAVSGDEPAGAAVLE